MADASQARGGSKRELGRGERVLPGIWRLRLPLPWPGVPHCNAWALKAGDGVVLVDTGMHQPGSMSHLERAMEMCGLKVEDVRLVVCTHAHSDHVGQAASIMERTGCELWMHPNHAHMLRMFEDPKAELERRLEVARQSGVPEEPLRRYAEQREDHDPGIAPTPEPNRDLLPGVVIETDLGDWSVHETPGHAPSHVCLFQADRRILVSGDHLLGRISLYFDYGYTPDPVGEFLDSLDVIEALKARLCLSGHGRTFTDVDAHIEGNRSLVSERLRKTLAAIERKPRTAFETLPDVYGGELSPFNTPWLLTETLSMLAHLEAEGLASRVDGGERRVDRGERQRVKVGVERSTRDEPERWMAN